MKRIFTVVFLTIFFLPADYLRADETDEAGLSHPWLTDTFLLSAGAFMPSKQIELSARGSVDAPNRRVDVDESFRGDSREEVLAMTAHWRFGKRWWLSGEWYRTRYEGRATLEEEVEWNGLIFPKGSNAAAGFGTELARVVLGRELYHTESTDFGIGLGFHLLELSAFIEGEILVNGEIISDVREKVSASAPLPNLTAWYIYSWSPKWALVTRVDWLSASFKEYSGQILNANAGIHFQFSKHLGIGLAYKHFELDVDIDKRGWYGASEYSQSGAFVSLTTNW